MPPTTKPSKSEWEGHKETICNLYLNEGLELKEVQARLAGLGFAASKSQYVAKFKDWGVSKNIPAKTWKHVGLKIEKRKREGKDSVISINGVEISAKRVKKATSTHFYSVTQCLEIEENNLPSPPGLSVATPTSTQEVFLLGGWPEYLPWSTFAGFLDSHLPQISQKPLRFHGQLSTMQEEIQDHFLSGCYLRIVNSSEWQIIFGNIKKQAHSDLAQAVLPLSSDIECPADIQQDTFLKSTSSNHWGFKVLIYLASNRLLNNHDINHLWRVIDEARIGELAIFSESSQLKDALSWAAASEYLFQAGIAMRNADLVSWLLDTGMDPNRGIRPSFDNDLHLPLIAAMYPKYYPDVNMIRLLLKNGASPTLNCCDHHRSPIQSALWNCSYHEDSKVLDLFSEAAEALNNDPASQSTPYIHKVACFDVNTSRYHLGQDDVFDKMDYIVRLIQNHAAKTPQISTTLITPLNLIRAVENNNQRLVQIIYEHGLSMDCSDDNGRFPLEAAVQPSDDDLCDEMDSSRVTLLLNLGASPSFDPKSRGNGHCSPAVQTAVNSQRLSPGQIDAIRVLCQHPATVRGRPTCAEYDHHTLMDCALSYMEWEHYELTDVMIILHEAGLPFPKNSLVDALELAYNGNQNELDDQFIDIIRTLPEDSLDLSLTSESGWTALDYAVSMNHQSLEQFLVEKGGNHTRDFAFEYCRFHVRSMEKIEKVMARIQTSQNIRQPRALLIIPLIGTLRTVDLDCRASERVFELLHNYSLTSRGRKHDAYVLYNMCRIGDERFIRRASQLLPNTYNSATVSWLITTTNQWKSVSEQMGTFTDFLQGTWILTWAMKRALETKSTLDWLVNLEGTSLDYVNLNSSAFAIKLFGCNHSEWFPTDIIQWFACGLKASCYLGLLVIQTGDVEKVSELLEKGFQPNRRIAWSLTALQFAVARADRPMTLRLLKAGCDVDARSPWRDIPDNILGKIQSGVRNVLTSHHEYTHRRNALQLAVEKGDISMIKVLLDSKADVNGPPSRVRGATALQIACIKGYIGIVRLLISKAADINAPGAEYFGRTALEGAAEYGRLDVACLLLAHDCRVDGLFRRQYIRAVGFARAHGHYALSQRLQDFGTWKKADEDMLEQTDLRDKEPESSDLGEDLHEDEEISEVDPDEFKSDSGFTYPFGTDDDSDSGDVDSTI